MATREERRGRKERGREREEGERERGRERGETVGEKWCKVNLV